MLVIGARRRRVVFRLVWREFEVRIRNQNRESGLA